MEVFNSQKQVLEKKKWLLCKRMERLELGQGLLFFPFIINLLVPFNSFFKKCKTYITLTQFFECNVSLWTSFSFVQTFKGSKFWFLIRRNFLINIPVQKYTAVPIISSIRKQANILPSVSQGCYRGNGRLEQVRCKFLIISLVFLILSHCPFSHQYHLFLPFYFPNPGMFSTLLSI